MASKNSVPKYTKRITLELEVDDIEHLTEMINYGEAALQGGVYGSVKRIRNAIIAALAKEIKSTSENL